MEADMSPPNVNSRGWGLTVYTVYFSAHAYARTETRDEDARILWDGRPVSIRSLSDLRLLRYRRERAVHDRRLRLAVRSAVRAPALGVWDPMAVTRGGRSLGLHLTLGVVRRRPVRVVAPHLDVVRRELADLQGRVRAPGRTKEMRKKRRG